MITKTLTFIIEPNGYNEYNFECANRGVKLNLAIQETLENIRSRLKYAKDVTKAEEKFLEELRTALSEYYVEG